MCAAHTRTADSRAARQSGPRAAFVSPAAGESPCATALAAARRRCCVLATPSTFPFSATPAQSSPRLCPIASAWPTRCRLPTANAAGEQWDAVRAAVAAGEAVRSVRGDRSHRRGRFWPFHHPARTRRTAMETTCVQGEYIEPALAPDRLLRFAAARRDALPAAAGAGTLGHGAPPSLPLGSPLAKGGRVARKTHDAVPEAVTRAERRARATARARAAAEDWDHQDAEWDLLRSHDDPRPEAHQEPRALP